MARGGEAQEELLARIQRESNPVKKAKLEIRLGRVKLLQAIDEYDHGNLERCQQLLGVYLEQMRSSWGTLRASGRKPTRQPQGFKELDIALRGDARLLEDLQHRVPYAERGAVEKARQEVDQMRNEVLRALFPVERPKGAGNSSDRRDGAHFSSQKVLEWNA